MTIFWFWIACSVLAGINMVFLQWWEMKKNPNERLNLRDLLVGVGLTVCPVINTLVAGGTLIYIVAEIFPKIVLFGPKKS